MKRTNCFCHILVCMLLICITACDRDNSKIEDEIPEVIKNDFFERNPSAQISTAQTYAGAVCQIEFTDREQNEATTWYLDDTWKMTYTEIPDLKQLPTEVQNAFYNQGYGDAQNIEISKIERKGMSNSLYTLHFIYLWKGFENMEHNIYINDDGLYLKTLRSHPNDPRWSANLPEDHFDFITNRYKGAEIRGYINDGEPEYFILHNDTIKYVFFGGDVAANSGFWRRTVYELSKDTPIPDEVAKSLKEDDPDFVYTNLYYIESEAGNAYHFQDKKRDDELGYIIAVNYQRCEE